MSEPIIYLYLRVSTEKQNLESNKGELLLKVHELNLNYKVVIIEETASGMKHFTSRELGKIEFKKGDYFITTELSRIGRTINQIMAFVAKLNETGVKMYFTKSKFNIDNSLNSQVLLFAYSLCSQIERELISQRTKDALQNKKRNGDILGRPAGNMILDKHKTEILKMVGDGVKKKSIAEKFHCNANTVTKFLKKNKI